MTPEQERIILKGDTISIIFHEDESYIEVVFQGVTHTQEYRVALDVALKLAKGYQVKNWLFDQREMNVHPVDLKWAEEQWVPKSYQWLGKDQKQAYVVSQHTYDQFKDTIDPLQKEPQIALFTNPEKAHTWVTSF